MKRSRLTLPMFLVVASAVHASAQDFLFSNTASTRGVYKDSVILLDTGGSLRPLVSDVTTLGTVGSTGSVRQMEYRVVNGQDYLYWLNGNLTDAVYRGTDRNGNGVIDTTETEELFLFDSTGAGYIDELGGVFWVGVAGGGSDPGVWRMQDLNGDGDFMDTGEATQLVDPNDLTLGSPATTISSDDIRSAVAMPNGDCVWFEDDSRAWVRTTPAGVHSFYLIYRSLDNFSGAQPPINPDFGTTLPSFTNRMYGAALDPATGVLYLATRDTNNSPYILACLDGNGDGDANDAGEVTLFFDGTATGFTRFYDIDWYQGSLYVALDTNPGAEIVQLTDSNGDGDAMDPGEATSRYSGGTVDDPQIEGLTIVPSGTFGSSCINLQIDRNDDMSVLGGTLDLLLKDIPAGLQSANVSAIGALSITGDRALPLRGCVVGLSIDGLTTISIGYFVTAPVTSSTIMLPSLPYPAGLPAGGEFQFIGLLLDSSTAWFSGYTGTGRFRIQ